MENRTEAEEPVCRGLPTGWFFPDFEDPDAKPLAALAIANCGACPVSAACLATALARGEAAGIWGGIAFDLALDYVEDTRDARAAGNGVAMAAALDLAEKTTTAYLADEPPPQRPWQEASTCTRCGCPVSAGRHPRDNASPKANCGRASTYNKGCRCDDCKTAKSEYQAQE